LVFVTIEMEEFDNLTNKMRGGGRKGAYTTDGGRFVPLLISTPVGSLTIYHHTWADLGLPKKDPLAPSRPLITHTHKSASVIELRVINVPT
jgi:hypothetical protein